MKKIIVVGHPHCGTSILKCKLGDCDNTIDYPTEIECIPEAFEKENRGKNIVIKWPFIPDDLWKCEFDLSKSDKYRDYIVVFVIRNPYYVFTSLKQRGVNIFRDYEGNIALYHRTIDMFVKLQNNPMPNVHLVLYEGLFDNDGLENVRRDIGLEKTEGYNKNGYKIVDNVLGVPIRQPDRRYHAAFRTWQINQDFQNMNQKIDLNVHEITQIMNNPNVVKLYPIK